MNVETKYYDQEELWNAPPEPYQVQVKKDILAFLPKDIQSILDIGCGNGFLTNSLPIDLEVHAMDIAPKALQHVTRNPVAGSVFSPPFKDNSFDLVMLNDVIEHVPPEIYTECLKNIQRLARKYIIITVPFMENLKSGMTLCGVCGTSYHVNHHFRNFGIVELGDLFTDYVPYNFVFSGSEVDYTEVHQRRLRQTFNLLNRWDKAVCPNCGCQASTTGAPDEASQAIDSMAVELPSTINAAWPDRSECIAIYKLRSQGQPEKLDIKISLSKLVESRLTGIDSKLSTKGNQLSIESINEEILLNNTEVYIVLRAGGRVYIYSNPREISSNKFLFPTWLRADNVARLSPNTASEHNLNEFLTKSWLKENANLKIRLGQMEQQGIDLQNAKAEIDSLKFRIFGLEERLGTALQMIEQRKGFKGTLRSLFDKRKV